MNAFSKGIIVFISTGAFSGYAPVMPGTIGCLAGIVVYLFFSFFSVPVYLLLTIIFVIAAIRISDSAEQIFKKNDPSEVVIDEIAGYLVAMATFGPDWKLITAGFVLFRIFDIVKPYPANRINKDVHGGLGIVLDDVVAGIYANIVLQAVRFFII